MTYLVILVNDTTFKLSRKRTFLSWTAEKGYNRATTFLVENGAHPDSRDYDGQTPLSWAVKNGHEVIITYLLEKGASPDSKDHSRRSPISWAVNSGNQAVIIQLLERSASRNFKVSGSSASLSLGEEGTLDPFRKKFDREVIRSHYDLPALLWALEDDFKEVINYLVENGADMNCADANGVTPLIRAALKGNLEMVRYFVKKGADINAKTKGSDTALSWAVKLNHQEMVSYLVENGAHVNGTEGSPESGQILA
jgi:ankyrin repeat protein